MKIRRGGGYQSDNSLSSEISSESDSSLSSEISSEIISSDEGFSSSEDVSSSEDISSESETTSIVIEKHIEFTSSKTNYVRGESDTLGVSISGTDDRRVNYSSSNPSVCTIDNEGHLSCLSVGNATITARLYIDSSVRCNISITVNEKKPTAISISGATSGSTYSIGSTIHLSTSVTPSDALDSVNWTSSANSVASVDNNGYVSFLAVGNVIITATSTIDTSVKQSISFNVVECSTVLNLTNENVPSTITDSFNSIPKNCNVDGHSLIYQNVKRSAGNHVAINTNGYLEVGNCKYTIQKLTVNYTGVLSLNYGFSSSNENTMVINNGAETYVKANVIRLTASTAANITSLVVTYKTDVKDYIIDSNWGAESWDFSKLNNANPTIAFNHATSTATQNAVFNNVTSQYYVIEGTVHFTNVCNDTAAWPRVSFGHIPVTQESPAQFHGMVLCPGANMASRRTCVMTVNDTTVNWGLETDRSQIWNSNVLLNLDLSNVKLTTIRYGDVYYYFINDILFWKETLFTAYSGINTHPAIQGCDANFTISDLSIINGQSSVSSYLTNHINDDTLFYTTDSNITVSSDNKNITFNGASTVTSSINIKDHAVKSCGDAVLLPSGEDTTITFDVNFSYFGNRSSAPALVATFVNHEVAEGTSVHDATQSILIAKNNFGVYGWNADGDMPDGFGETRSYSSALTSGTTYRVILVRNANGTINITIYQGTSVIGSYLWNWSGGTVVNRTLWLSARDADFTISNLTIGGNSL